MIKKIKENGIYNLLHQKFMIDSSSDLTTLESTYTCQMGDIAELPNGNYYCRHSDGYSGDLWELVEVGSRGSSGSSGSGLPSVTSDDNGKVLKVSNGQWGKGDSDKGYSTERGEVFIQEQTITSTSQGPYSTALLSNFDFSNLQEGDTCIITYDGVEYEIEMQKDNNSIIFGDFNLQTGIVDFTNYPFAIFTYNHDNTITAIVITEEIVTSISIKGETEVLTIEDSFKEAVKNVPTLYGYAGWLEALKDLVILQFEITATNSADVLIICSDCKLITSIEVQTDTEAGGSQCVVGPFSGSSEYLLPDGWEHYCSSISQFLENYFYEHYDANFYSSIGDIFSHQLLMLRYIIYDGNEGGR